MSHFRRRRRRSAIAIGTAGIGVLLMATSALGFGNFSGGHFYATGSTPYRVGVADVDKDGHPDIVDANEGSTWASVLWNKGNGTFSAPQKLSLGANSAPDGVAFGDFNKDGKLDIAITDFAQSGVVVFINKGHRAFKAGKEFFAGSTPVPIAVADINGDGKLDICVGDYYDSKFWVLTGDGHGSFALPVGGGSVGTNPEHLIVHDFTGDGKLDIVTAAYGGSTLSLVPGHGNGTFAPARTLHVGDGPNGLVTGDFNGDGFPDLATANLHSNNVSILLGEAHGQFHQQSLIALGGTVWPNGLAVGDFDGNHTLDLAVGEQYRDAIAIIKGNGHGSFALSPTTFNTGIFPADVQAAKLNADAALDLVSADLGVISDPNGGGAFVLLNH